MITLTFYGSFTQEFACLTDIFNAVEKGNWKVCK